MINNCHPPGLRRNRPQYPLEIPRRIRGSAAAVTAVLLCMGAAEAANIAPLGTAIIGVNDAVDGDAGTPRANSGAATNINDGDSTTRVDNWFGSSPTDGGQAISFVGIVWPSVRYEQVSTVNITLATFSDGGWFGVKNTGPGPGGALATADLIEPTVQVSTNFGTNWITVPATSTYLAGLNGHTIGGGDNPNPTEVSASFTLTTPATRITGIRIIGENGGTADGNGFIGVFELDVDGTPGADSDSDGLPDGWEQDHGLNVGANDSGADPDSDGLTHLEEFGANTDPALADTDGDGLNDGAEVKTAMSDPLKPDSDGDGLTDGREVNELQTNPNLADTDEDGLNDAEEADVFTTDPKVADTDGDSYPDGLEVAQGSDPKSASSIPENYALSGRAILGTKPDLEGGIDTELEYIHAGIAESINDGDFSTRVDTWNGDTAGNVSYVGIVWDQPLTNTVVRVELTLATFFDGGWFGVNGVGPGAGGALTTNHLAEPTVEISNDSGASWTAAPHTSDYIETLAGHLIGGGSQPNPSSVAATFTLNTPVTGITGIRLIGNDGGTASGGFLGVFELRIRPSSSDSDSDGMEDEWERQNGLNVGTNDATGDLDSDGATNLQEFTAGTDPRVADTDGDGLNDGPELTQHMTNPSRADTDNDGLTDGNEVTTLHTNPLASDSDGDGFADGLEVNLGSDPALASSFPANQSARGTGILGTKADIDSEIETPIFNAGSASAITDGNLTTRVDSFGGGGDTLSFVGVVWPQPLTTPIVKVELTLAVFFDGGWFGPNGTGPGTGGTLSSEFLTEPVLQVTTDGTTWTNINFTTDYLEVFDGHPLPDVDFGAPTSETATFTPAQPVVGARGIRVIGNEGGTASGGFLGVFDFSALAESSTGVEGVRLLNPAFANTEFRFEFDTVAGVTHTVEYKNALSDATWQTLTTVTGDGTRKPVTDTQVSGGQKYYRVTQPQ